ncbi:BglII/BstYI family type II restriction endonuclease [Mesorhizobium sp. 1M-11]|uniref:BglII/BstYI family type II restriction endonuclease n=1 Tax=Mesorhizobium sp. 1M-11 TaxID=1529006 RepID=UPI0006C75B20|nr:BglII/BstYI family type II restriction endonuclease [Mesorhizobium sp. 1M-11]
MKVSIHSHCSGAERVPDSILSEVVAAATAIEVRAERGAAPRIRDRFVAELREKGWSGEVTVARGSDMSITSMRNGIGLCLQTGNMARMYADLIKLQTLYLDNAIEAAIFVLPSQPLAAAIGDNIAQATRLQRELEIFRKAYHVPTLVLSLE